LPTLLGTRTIPYGLISPFEGTVEAIVETDFSGARNATVLVAELVVDALVVAGAEAELELLLLELPQPASARTTPARARIDVLGTGYVSCPWDIRDSGDTHRSPQLSRWSQDSGIA
jgi:hypothetical protein